MELGRLRSLGASGSGQKGVLHVQMHCMRQGQQYHASASVQVMRAVDCGSPKLNLQISWTVTQQANH